VRSVKPVVELNNNLSGAEEVTDEVENTIARSMTMSTHTGKRLGAPIEELENSTHPVRNTIKSIQMSRLVLPEEVMIESSAMAATDREDNGEQAHQCAAEMISI
jgi:hypothetical protein